MSDINQIIVEVDLYGSPLKGTETEIDKARMARKWYLKGKIRRWLAWQTGDTLDVLADTMKAVILGQAICLGIVTNKGIIDKHKDWVKKMLDGYSTEEIQVALETFLNGVDTQVFKKLNVAKSAISTAVTIDDVQIIDVE